MSTTEANYDGLVGLTHNYSGLSHGNLASQSHADQTSYPKQAALQGLEKMKYLSDLGLVQGVIAPQERPFLPYLKNLGLTGSDQQIWESAWDKFPHLARNMVSASSMWAANAATLSPSSDSQQGKLKITPANLHTMLQRSIEHEQTARFFKKAFPDKNRFMHHPALPSHPAFADEGAANHNRLCGHHGEEGVEIFVYGESWFSPERTRSDFPARQTLEASKTIALNHGLRPERTVFVRQADEAISAGAFHNDVVCVSNQTCLFYHEKAFQNTAQALEEIKHAAEGLFEPVFIEVSERDVSLENAVSSYLFNSQLVTDSGEMQSYSLIAPEEVKENDQTRRYCEKLVSGNGPIRHVRYVNVRQSMCNGGGPACLRLRIVLTEQEKQALNSGLLMTDSLSQTLKDWINQFYRDRLSPEDLKDPALINETHSALDALTSHLNLGSDFYPFQRENI